MRHGMPIIDIDRHVMEPTSMWTEYLPKRFHEVAPEIVPLTPPEPFEQRLARLGELAMLSPPSVHAVQGRPLCRGMTEIAYIEVGLQAAARRRQLVAAQGATGQLEAMDEEGIDIAVLLPTLAPLLVYDDEIDAERSRAYANAYNRWIADLRLADPLRLEAAALVSRHDPERMVEDLRSGLGLGLRAVVLRPNPVCGRTIGAPELEPFYAACAAEGVPVLLHEGAHTRVETAGATRFRTHFGQHACSHPMEAMMAFLSLLEGGVLEHHPDLRVGFLEAGCGWLPYWLWRLDELEFPRARAELGRNVESRPSEYFRRQCWIALEPGEALLEDCVRHVGAGRFVFGTDFPHPDHEPDIVQQLFEGSSALDPATVAAVLWDNPAALMGFDSTRLADVVRAPDP